MKFAVALGYLRLEQAERSAQFARENLAGRPAIRLHRGVLVAVPVVFVGMLHAHAHTDRSKVTCDAFLASGDREPGLVRVLIERRDQVLRALRSRNLPAEVR